MMTSSWRHFMLFGFENPSVCKIEYGLLPFQVSKLWVVWIDFMEVSVRPPKHHYDVIMTSFLITEFPTYFVEHDISYQPSKFRGSRMSGSNFMEVGGTPSQCYKKR